MQQHLQKSQVSSETGPIYHLGWKTSFFLLSFALHHGIHWKPKPEGKLIWQRPSSVEA